MQGKALPNIVFDTTLKNKASIEKIIPRLLAVGYDSKDIHLVWVLTKFQVAVKNNATRERVVPDDILLDTHVGAGDTMMKILRGSIPKGLDGEIHIINNNKEKTVFWTDSKGKKIVVKNKKAGTKDQEFVVKDFLSLLAKEAGKGLVGKRQIRGQLFKWVRENTPTDQDIVDMKAKINKS